MANGWQTDPYGNQVWMPINPGADPGTAWAQEELGEVKDFLGEDKWEDYGGYFDPYGTGEFYEKEKMQRVGAGIDIGQLGKAWELKAGQLGTAWGTEETGAWGELFRQREGAGTTWGLQRGELERGGLDVTEIWRLQEEDITRKELEASGLWTMQRGGLEEGWEYKRGALGRGTQSGLRQAISAQETATGKVGFARGGTREFERMQREIREGYGKEVTEGERVLAQNLGIGEEQLTQTLATYASQRGLGKEQLTQALAGITGKIDIGEQALIDEEARIDHLISTGQMTYDQAIETGQFQVGAGITDIGQALQGDIWSTRQAWREQQRATLHSLLGMDIWGEGGPPSSTPGSTVDITPETEWGGDEYGGDWDPFEAYDDEFGGWGEDYDYEDWWEFESEYS